MTRKQEPRSPGKPMFLVIWWMSKNPYAAVFENRIAAEAAANVRNAILVTFKGNGSDVEAVVDWFRRDEEGRPIRSRHDPSNQIETVVSTNKKMSGLDVRDREQRPFLPCQGLL